VWSGEGFEGIFFNSSELTGCDVISDIFDSIMFNFSQAILKQHPNLEKKIYQIYLSSRSSRSTALSRRALLSPYGQAAFNG
jgi:hypothetical protein